MSRECQEKEEAREAARAHSAQQSADKAAQLAAMQKAALSQDKLVRELQACSIPLGCAVLHTVYIWQIETSGVPR